MQVVAVPVKALPQSKSRLASVLTGSERAALTLAQLDDVLGACVGQAGWETWVVSPDPVVLEAAGARGARPVRDERGSLLGAVRQIEAMLPDPFDVLAVVLGDLPYVTAADIRAALDTDGPVVAAPAASDGGTNLLLRRPASVIPAKFGRASFDRHRWEASRRGIELVEVRAPGLEEDLDRPGDLARLIARSHRSRTRSVCLEMGLARRLWSLDRA